MNDVAAVNREGVEGVPSMVAGAIGREWYREQLAGMDPLRGTRPAGASVEYVSDVAAGAAATGSPVLVLAPTGVGSRTASWTR